MEIRVQVRQSGKSFDLARIMKIDKEIACIVPNLQIKDWFCGEFNIDKNRVFSFIQFLNGNMKGKDFKKIVIDELGACLNTYDTRIIIGTHTN